MLQLAENSGMSNRFHALSLGQGQAPIATRMIKEGVKDVSSLELQHLKDVLYLSLSSFIFNFYVVVFIFPNYLVVISVSE